MADPVLPLMPSGEQYVIRHGEQRVTVVEVGGGLREYLVGERPVLDGYGEREPCSGGRGQMLIPWPNRLRDGRYEFDGHGHQLPLTETETETAIHGLVRWVSWTAAEHDESRVAMAHVLHPQPGWPGTLRLTIEYALGEDGLTVTLAAVNAGQEACPFGAGAHPYLTLATETIDSLTLRAPGGSYLPADERGLPTGVRSVNGTELDFRAGRRIGSAHLDQAYTELERDGDGLARVRIETDGGDRSATLWLGAEYEYLMLFTGDTLAPARRRRGLAIEPMTCAPNALQSGDGLRRLEPGERFSASWGISPA